ncbi:hypothetical protein ACO0SA_004234 [Hanseniaspora valbyensis]
MFSILKDDSNLKNHKDPLDLNNTKHSIMNYVDYIDDSNANSNDYKYKSLKQSLDKLLQQFDNDLINSVNNTLVSNDSNKDDSSSNPQEAEKPSLLSTILSDNKEQSSPTTSTDDDWADYISRLGKLNKLLSTTKSLDMIPYSNRINKHLIVSLNKNLPSGVHIKTLQIYLQIFNIIGLENLNQQASLWIISLLPVVQYASLSVKPILLEIFKDWILKLNVENLILLLGSLLKSMLSGIDQDSDDFLQLINELRNLISDDWLFMSSFFKILIETDNENDSDIKMNALLWLNEPVNDFLNLEVNNKLFLKAMIFCIKNGNDILCCRGYLDYLIKKKIFLNEEKFFNIESGEDNDLMKNKFIETLLRLLLNKDISLNRRIYQLLLPSFATDSTTNEDMNADDSIEKNKAFEFYQTHLVGPLTFNLENNFKTIETASILKLLIIKWENIGVDLFKKLIIIMMKNLDLNDKALIFNISQLFEIVDSTIIIKCLLEQENFSSLELLINVVQDDDDEMIVKHFPMLLLYLLTCSQKIHYQLILKILNKIPDRAFFTVSEESTVPDCKDLKKENLIKVNEVIKNYYFDDDKQIQHTLPYQISDLLSVAVFRSFHILTESLNELNHDSNIIIQMFISFYTKLPQFQQHEYIDYNKINSQLLNIFEHENKTLEYEILLSLIKLYKTVIFNKTFKFDNTDLESINNSLNVVKTFKIIISQIIYPKLFEIDKNLEYLSILNSFIKINEKFVNKFLLQSFINDSDHNIQKKLILLESIVSNNSLLSFMSFIDHLLDSQNEIINDWLFVNLIQKKKNENLSKVLEYYLTNLIVGDETVFIETIQKLNNLISNVLKNETELLEKEGISTDLKILLQEKGFKFDNPNVNTYQGLIMNILLNNITSTDNLHIITVRCLEKIITGDEYYIIKPIIEKTYAILKNENEVSDKKIEESNTKEISVKLIEILIKLITNSNMSDKNDIILSYLDFIVSSIDLIKNFDVITAFINLLEVSYIQLDNDTVDSNGTNSQVIFNIILPLGTTILNKLDSVFNTELENISGEGFDFFSILVNGVNELLETSKSQLQEQKINFATDTQQRNKNDFFTSVFTSNSQRANKLATAKNRLAINEQLIEQFFNMILKRFYDIWNTCNLQIKQLSESNNYNSKSLVLIIQGYKHRIKTFLQHNFNKNTDLLLKLLINNNIDNCENLVYLVLSLDGNRPILTIPTILNLINAEFDIVYLQFINEYLKLLETSAIEEVYGILMDYFKDVNVNTTGNNSILSIKILSLLGINTRFENKKDVISYYELISKSLNNIFADESIEEPLVYQLATDDIIPLLSKDLNDILLNTLYNKFVTPLFKKDLTLLEQPILQFWINITPYLSTNKTYKSSILSILDGNNYTIFVSNEEWKTFLKTLLGSQILQSYPIDLLAQLLNSKNTFNWSKQEILNKNIVILQKLALLLEVNSFPQITPLLIEYLLKNTDFNQISLFLVQIQLLNIILENNITDGIQINTIELVELLRDSLRNFQHYYIHSRGSLNDLKESSQHDLSFCALLGLISRNKIIFNQEDGLWSELYKFKELTFVTEKTEEEEKNLIQIGG